MWLLSFMYSFWLLHYLSISEIPFFSLTWMSLSLLDFVHTLSKISVYDKGKEKKNLGATVYITLHHILYFNHIIFDLGSFLCRHTRASLSAMQWWPFPRIVSHQFTYKLFQLLKWLLHIHATKKIPQWHTHMTMNRLSIGYRVIFGFC